MNENEAVYCLKADSELHSEVCEECDLYGLVGCNHCQNDAIEIAIKALEEVQQYRAIGTPEECQAAMEKQTAKKISSAWCPNCKKYLTTQHLKGKYHCVYCGQKLDWSDEE